MDIKNIRNNEKHEFVKCVARLAPEQTDRIRFLIARLSEPTIPDTSINSIIWPELVSHKTGKIKNRNYAKEMKWAVNNPQFHDVVFVVGDCEEKIKRFVAHKVVLCARSNYFKAMLTGGMKVS